ncbi:MAG: hypothetical protein PUJ51_12090 [Clostridiales bacterium]|nr:hypothetical protein [Terrisporobacter sp.]MDD7755225.1 hypothetical protein [Clostridiales bacterium]MDY4134157.1 hypothetical protein [Terrisporobacter sp.]
METAKNLLHSYEEVIPVIRNVKGKGFTDIKFSPIQTVEGDLQKSA